MNALARIIEKYRKLGFVEFKQLAIAFIKYKYKMRLGYFIHRTASIKNKKLIEIGKYAEIQEYVIIKTFQNAVKIGKYTQINPFTVIYGGSGVYIGDNVMIAPHCMIASGNHNHKQLDKPIRHSTDVSKGPITIEDGVWIGANSTIIDGVTIGHNAVVSANSVVTKNVLPFDVVGGVPARVIANRLETTLNKKLSDEEKVIYSNIYREKYSAT